MPSPITIGVAALPALRSGLYLKLNEVDDALDESLMDSTPSLEDHPWSVVMRIRAVADLLDKVGWAEPGAPAGVPTNDEPIQIESAGEAQLLIDALRLQIEDQETQAEDIQTTGRHDAILAAQQRIRSTQRILAGRQAAIATAKLHKTASTTVVPAIERLSADKRAV